MKTGLLRKLAYFVFVVAGLLVFYSYLIEPNLLKKEYLKLHLDCVDSSDNKRPFVQVSDLHFSKDTSDANIERITVNISSLNPAAVFITGDLISDKSGIPQTTKLARIISADYPVYIVFGNWDYWSLDFDTNDFKNQLEDAGAKVLVNSNEKISAGNSSFYILGVKDPYTSGENELDVEKALAGIDNREKSCKILLAHSPNVIKYAKGKNIDLILVGHTHGGQVYVPFATEYFIPSRREAGKGYVKGLYELDKDKMYVNRGIGTSMLPLRFLVPPELTVIEIN